MKEHHDGFWISIGALIAGGGAWLLRNIEVINELMHFAILTITLICAIVGARKVLRK